MEVELVMRIRNWFGRKSKGVVVDIPFRYAGDSVVAKTVNDALAKYGKGLCLDIGSGVSPHPCCTTLDMVAEKELKDENGKVTKVVVADIVGDVRQLFAPGYMEHLEDDSPLHRIKPGFYRVVRLHHMLEHVEWIYGDFFFRWVFSILCDGGMVSIDTPNAEISTRVYIANMDRIRKGNFPEYPSHEHPYCNPDVPWHIQKWFNFKLFSGCSPGDYHLASYSAYGIGCMLAEQGFERISIFEGYSVLSVAYKPGGGAIGKTDVENVVSKVMVGR